MEWLNKKTELLQQQKHGNNFALISLDDIVVLQYKAW